MCLFEPDTHPLLPVLVESIMRPSRLVWGIITHTSLPAYTSVDGTIEPGSWFLVPGVIMGYIHLARPILPCNSPTTTVGYQQTCGTSVPHTDNNGHDASSAYTLATLFTLALVPVMRVSPLTPLPPHCPPPHTPCLDAVRCMMLSALDA